jgi:hypothetical protein
MATFVEAPASLLNTLMAHITADLTAPRPINAQTLRCVCDEFAITEEGFTEFVATTYPTLQDFELDVLFSPQLTPSLHDGERYMAIVGSQTLSGALLDQLIEQLANQALTMPVQLSHGQTVALPLPEVLIERYVRRLGLDKALDAEFAAALEATTLPERYPLLLTVARDPIFQKPFQQSALLALLKADPTAAEALVVYLVDFMRTYRPDSFTGLHRQLLAYVDSCQKDQAAVTQHQFHHEELKASYEDSELQASKVKAVQDRYASMMNHAIQLMALLPKT